jgi:hypothetical protein
MGAGPALPDVPDDQVAGVLRKLPIPVGQQLSQYGAGLPPGQRDMQGTKSFLQLSAGTFGQGVRLALRRAERDGQIVVVQVVPEAQLNDLTLTRL